MREALTWGAGLVLALLLHLGIGLAVFWPLDRDGAGQTDSGGTLAGEMTVLVLEDAGEGAAGADADRTAGTETGEEKPETPQAEPERKPEPEPLPDLAPVPEPAAQPESQQVPEVPAKAAVEALPDPAVSPVAQVEQSPRSSQPPLAVPLPRPAPKRPVHKPAREANKAPPRKTASRASPSRRGDAQVSTRKGNAGGGRRAAAGGKKGERASYALKLRRRVERYKRYPPGATPGALRGVGKLKITIDRRGRVKRATLVRKTGIAALDRELRKLARRASPFPAVPESIAGPTLTFTVPVRFGKRK